MKFCSEAEARAALDGIHDVDWRGFDRDDLPSVAAFYADCELHDKNPERTSLVGLQEYWDSPRSVPEQDTLLGRDTKGEIVAAAWSGCNRALTAKRGVSLKGAVRPDRRGEGIGAAVLRWELAHADAWDVGTRREGYGPLVIRLVAPVDQTDLRDLAAKHGLRPARYFFEMSRRLPTPPEVPEIPGVRLLDWDDARSARTHTMMDEAFRDHWGHTASTSQMWQEKIGSQAFRRSWSVLAVDVATDQVVGAALNVAWEQDWQAQGYTEGYTEQLGVLRSHRGRGIAAGLLVASMRRFARSGMEAAGLGVDSANQTGALRLYEKLGYRQTASICVHQLSRP